MDSVRKAIADSLAAIARATKVISDNQARIAMLMDQHVPAGSLLAQASPPSPNDSNEDEFDHSESTASHPVHNTSDGDLQCPECNHKSPDTPALKRHYATHTPLDEKCLCCEQSIKSVSIFKKSHAGCLKKLGSRLSPAQRKKALEQKSRIGNDQEERFKNAIKDLTRKSEKEPEKAVEETSRNTKRARVWDDDEPSPKRHMDPTYQSDSNETCISASMNYGAAMFLTQPGSYQAFDPNDIRLVTDSHGVTGSTNFDDEFSRGLAMVLNPIDGTVDWEGI